MEYRRRIEMVRVLEWQRKKVLLKRRRELVERLELKLGLAQDPGDHL